MPSSLFVVTSCLADAVPGHGTGTIAILNLDSQLLGANVTLAANQ